MKLEKKIKQFLKNIASQTNDSLVNFKYEKIKLTKSVLIVFDISTQGKYKNRGYYIDTGRIEVPISDLEHKSPNVCRYNYRFLNQVSFDVTGNKCN